MHTNNLGVRVGSLHLYETDVDEQDFALQQGTTSHKIKNFCICFSSNKEVAPSNRRIFRKYLCTDFLLFNIIIALNFKQMCHEVFLCDLDLNKLKTQPWHEIHVIVYIHCLKNNLNLCIKTKHATFTDSVFVCYSRDRLGCSKDTHSVKIIRNYAYKSSMSGSRCNNAYMCMYENIRPM